MKPKSISVSPLKSVMGPLWKIFSEDSVYTICVDSFDDVYYTQKNESKAAANVFKTPKDVDALVARLLRFTDRELDKDQHTIYLNLDELTKVLIVFPPMSVKGPSLIINKLPRQELTLDDYIRFKVLDEEGKALLLKIIGEGKGILVAGHPGSGKTTLLNLMVNAIPQPKRVVTIERYADLVIRRSRVVRLQAPNQKADEMVELVAAAEKLYPDYLVTSYFDGPEVMPFLEAARSTCSALGLTTGENPLDALKRLETKAVLSSEGMSLEEARYAIAQTFRHIVYQERRGNLRVVSSVAEIEFVEGELKLKPVLKR